MTRALEIDVESVRNTAHYQKYHALYVEALSHIDKVADTPHTHPDRAAVWAACEAAKRALWEHAGDLEALYWQIATGRRK